jgi:hypothetical protein
MTPLVGDGCKGAKAPSQMGGTKMQGRGMKAICAALVTGLMSLGLAGAASAHLTGDFTVFQQCPWTNPAVKRCLHAQIEGGGIAIGEKGWPITNPVTLQAGFIEAEKGEPTPIFAAANGETLSKSPQQIPGGLLAMMPVKTVPPALKGLLQGFANSSLNRLTATLELAGTAKISFIHLAEGEGTASVMPAKIHLENPLLGKNCYIGSIKTPIVFELTVGTTNPPPPNLPISGNGGSIEYPEEGEIILATGSELVDNAWSVPKASGCGGVLSFLIDPIINKQMGLPSPAGRNTAILMSTASISTAFAVQENDAKNP